MIFCNLFINLLCLTYAVLTTVLLLVKIEILIILTVYLSNTTQYMTFCSICYENIDNDAICIDSTFLNCSCYNNNSIHKQCFVNWNNLNRCVMCNSKYKKPLQFVIINNILFDKNTDQVELSDNIKYDSYLLKYIKEQPPEICLKAVQQNGFALQFVKEQTPEICLAAVRQNLDSHIFVKDNMYESLLSFFPAVNVKKRYFSAYN